MLLWTILKVALKSLMANKLRSFLAMLGIIIGVGAVISMLALGAGAQRQILDKVTDMGSNLLVLRPGMMRINGVRSGSRRTLKISDAEAIRASVEGIEALSPVVRTSKQVKYYNRNTNTSINGVSREYFNIRSFSIWKGRLFSELEEDRGDRVAVIGASAADTLFEDEDGIGKTIRIGDINFKVVGIMEPKGDQGWFNPDTMILAPYRTVMQKITGQVFLNEINIKAKDESYLVPVEEKVKSILRRRHRIRPESYDDFHIRNQAEILEMVSSFTSTFTILLGGIASISLLVGGIGIMNIMLVTVTERTREIGVRKAIGARDCDILRQFLLESILISGLGGLLGIGMGFGVAELVSNYTSFVTIIEMQSIVLSIAVSATVGIFFGYYPARRAAKLDPIDALRYE